MKTLGFPATSNLKIVADFIRSRRLELKKNDKTKYAVRNVANVVGCSLAHYESLERGEDEFTDVKWLYGTAKILEIPFDALVGMYLGLTEDKLRKHFTISVGDLYSTNNSWLIKNKRRELGYKKGAKIVQEDVARAVGCSKSHIAHVEREARKIKDIRLLYGIAEYLEIPLWVLVRNELGLDDEKMQEIISFSPINSLIHLRKEIMTRVEAIPDEKLEAFNEFLNKFENL